MKKKMKRVTNGKKKVTPRLIGVVAAVVAESSHRIGPLTAGDEPTDMSLRLRLPVACDGLAASSRSENMVIGEGEGCLLLAACCG